MREERAIAPASGARKYPTAEGVREKTEGKDASPYRRRDSKLRKRS